MSPIFWDRRYSGQKFVYGMKPNQFFKHIINKLDPGKILESVNYQKANEDVFRFAGVKI